MTVFFKIRPHLHLIIYFLRHLFLVFIEIEIKICLSYIRIKKKRSKIVYWQIILFLNVVVTVNSHSEQLTHTYV